MFVRHCLAVGELVVGLVGAERDSRCQRLSIECEPEVWRRYVGPHGTPAVLKPDLGIRLSTSQVSRVWLVEVDRATESPKRIRRKALQYLEYWRTGLEQKRVGTFPRVMWSVPDPPRQASIERVLGGLPDPAGAMFVVAAQPETLARLLEQPTTTLKGGQ